MAWTTPKTWSAGETLTAANFNTHIRDNLNATGPHLIGRKTSDQSVTSSTVLVDATTLGLTVAASEIWAIEYRLRMVAGGAGAGGYKLAWTFPTSGEIEFTWLAADSTGVATNEAVYATSSPSGASASDIQNASPSVNSLFVHGFYVGGGNAGTCQLQFAQYNSSATATTIKANSIIMAVKLA